MHSAGGLLLKIKSESSFEAEIEPMFMIIPLFCSLICFATAWAKTPVGPQLWPLLHWAMLVTQSPSSIMQRVPMGVVAIIYEARPNVTCDAAALCIKTGNAVILKGGSDAIYSNLAKLLTEKLSDMQENND